MTAPITTADNINNLQNRLTMLENEVRTLKSSLSPSQPYQPIAPNMPVITLSDEQVQQIKKALENH